jgi:hypothetical protein
MKEEAVVDQVEHTVKTRRDYTVVVRKFQVKRPHRKPGHSWEGNFKMDFRCELD